MKKYISTFLVAVLCLGLSVSAGATNTATNSQGLTEDNIKHVETIFQNKALIVDENGTDVTNTFIEENRDRYQAGDYNAILDCLIDQNLAIEEQVPVSLPETRLVVNGAVNSSRITRYFDSPLTGTTTKEWITFYFTGHYRVNDYSNTIDSGVKVDGVNCVVLRLLLGRSVTIIKKSHLRSNTRLEFSHLHMLSPTSKTAPQHFLKHYHKMGMYRRRFIWKHLLQYLILPS